MNYHKQAHEALIDCKYFFAFKDGDEGIIALLDEWLSDFLYKKSECPICGDGLPWYEKVDQYES